VLVVPEHPIAPAHGSDHPNYNPTLNAIPTIQPFHFIEITSPLRQPQCAFFLVSSQCVLNPAFSITKGLLDKRFCLKHTAEMQSMGTK
jgi:hypothetical protein